MTEDATSPAETPLESKSPTLAPETPSDSKSPMKEDKAVKKYETLTAEPEPQQFRKPSKIGEPRLPVPTPDNIPVRKSTRAKWRIFGILCALAMVGWTLAFWDEIAPDLKTYADRTHSNATFFMATFRPLWLWAVGHSYFSARMENSSCRSAWDLR